MQRSSVARYLQALESLGLVAQLLQLLHPLLQALGHLAQQQRLAGVVARAHLVDDELLSRARQLRLQARDLRLSRTRVNRCLTKLNLYRERLTKPVERGSVACVSSVRSTRQAPPD